MQSKKVENGYLIRIDKGEELMAAIIGFIAEKGIPSGVISGIGALTDVELGYFNRDRQEYQRQKFDNIYELLSLKGNISYIDGKPIVHAHCILGRNDYGLIGGHLFSGEVAVTAEVFVQVFNERISRAMNPELKLNLLRF
jgi:predicted DNA-binding protein with PD1-like motif